MDNLLVTLQDAVEAQIVSCSNTYEPNPVHAITNELYLSFRTFTASVSQKSSPLFY